MLNIISKTVLVALVIYISLFMYVLLEVANGNAGNDALSNHYRHVIQLFVKK